MPSLAPQVLDAIEPIRADPTVAALLFDFDGTLSPVVGDPAQARPAPGVEALLADLAERYRVVGVVSGRPVEFLTSFVPPGVVLSGLYGLESRMGDQTVDHSEAPRWRTVVAEVSEALLADAGPGGPLAGALVEPKGLSITIHVRTHPEVEPAVRAAAAAVAASTGLVVRDAKMSVELHPPIGTDKGAVVRSMADGCSSALFVGDDRGDIAAFEAIEDLVADERLGLGVTVAVGGPELPAELAARATVVLGSQADVVGLLGALADGS